MKPAWWTFRPEKTVWKEVAWYTKTVSFVVEPGSWVCDVAVFADGKWMPYSECSEQVLVS